MIFRDKAPIPGVLRTVTIVTHHPVIIHFKGILVGLLVIQEYLSVPYLECIAFIDPYSALIEGIVFQGQGQNGAFPGYPYRSVIIF